MAFNIMDLFGPGAINRLLQPIQNASGVQNFLANPQAAAGFDPARFGGSDRLPAVGMDALRERMGGQPVEVAAAPTADPWAGMREADVVKLDPVMTGSAPQPQPQVQPAGSKFPGVDRSMLQDLFIGMAMGQTPQQSMTLGAVQAARGKKDRGAVNETVEWLKGRGMDEGQARMVAGNPETLQSYLKQIMTPEDPMKGLTDDQREYEAAKAQGFEGSFMDYQIKMKEAGRSQINLDTGEKLPSGFRWKNPEDKTLGVEPIPGGPATQVPGELAARVGMGENFLENDLPFLRKQENLEAAVGPVDRAMAWAGRGLPAQVERKFQSGVEVLSRLLSGAGMTQVEIDEKTKRYMPTLADTTKSLETKLDQLEAEIRAAGDAAMRGRGDSISGQTQSGGGDDPLGLRGGK